MTEHNHSAAFISATSRGVFCRVFINVSRETHTKMVAVIDYGMKNLRSIRNALMVVKIAHALTIVLIFSHIIFKNIAPVFRSKNNMIIGMEY